MKKIKKHFSKANILRLLIVLNLILVVIYLIYPVKIEYSVDNTESRTFLPSEKMKSGNIYTQKILSTVSNFNSIGIKFSTYLVNNKTGKINIKMFNQNKETIFNKNIKLKDIKDNEIDYITFPSIKKSKGKEYELYIDCQEYNNDNSLAYWFTTENITKDMTINNNIIEQEIYVVIKGKKADYFIVWYPAFLSFVLYGMLILIEGEKNEKK